MTDQNETPVPTFQTRKLAGVVEIPTDLGQITLPVSVDVPSGTAVVTLLDGTRVEQTVITTHGDLVAAAIGAAVEAGEDAKAGRSIPLVGKESFTPKEVVEIAFQAAGAATGPLLVDHPGYVFPSERVQEAVDRLLADFGLRAHGDGTVDRIVPPNHAHGS